MKGFLKIDSRLLWWGVMIWLLAILVGGVVVLPWFYLVMPFAVLATTKFYFKKVLTSAAGKKRTNEPDRILAAGLSVSLMWFLILLVINALEIIGPYYFNVVFFYSDFRNWFVYPLILLTPVVYSLVVANARLRKSKKFRLGIKNFPGISA